jgi:hypothetical protein
VFEAAPGWISRSPLIRRSVVTIWRAFLRLQRATSVHAVVVLHRGRLVLAVTDRRCEQTLPRIELDGWKPLPAQVERLAEALLRRPLHLELRAIDGAPSKAGVTLVYAAELPGDPPPATQAGAAWLPAAALSQQDRRLSALARH